MEEKLRNKAKNNIGIPPRIIYETFLAIKNNPIWIYLYCIGNNEKPAVVVSQLYNANSDDS